MTQENLALLYQGLLTGIVRIRSGKQPLANAEMFRRRTKEALGEVTREAIKRGYAAEHTMETDFALVALLDEVILSSHDPSREAWAQRPLQEELFGLTTAGEIFFARIEKLLRRPDSKELADMLEVYYLCILLGFEGQYATQPKTELHLLADRVRQRIERIRGGDTRFSPAGFLPDEPVAVAPPDRIAGYLKTGALALGGAALVIFLLASAHLFWSSSQVRDALAKALLT
ncbi:MAG TPA: DotU family type IV/VI secretion system protein [Bryobacteraceae bacterium]|jgi:type VI secretion system protein ImpK|nr:DotU family type IV/VI secretion system protein [Bryobacteraceae bacterium]